MGESGGWEGNDGDGEVAASTGQGGAVKMASGSFSIVVIVVTAAVVLCTAVG